MKAAITVAIIAIFVIKFKMGLFDFLEGLKPKDTTAQGLARIRHAETILEDPSQRLYEDPYAEYMYFGSSIANLMGGNRIRNLIGSVQVGMFDVLTLRTKWIDDEIMTAANSKTVQQLLILGAGYDTRGFRLDLPDGFLALEVDQPEVQASKLSKLRHIAKTDETVASRLDSSNTGGPKVEHVSINFNKDSISKETILDPTSFDGTKPTIATLEGVTQYIPDTSTASTLKQVHSLLPEGSLLLISYVPDALYDRTNKTEKKLKQLDRFLKIVALSNEPWITSWSPESFESFLKDCGFQVVSDVSVEELNDKYLVEINRGLAEDEKLELERYVVAKIVK